jgi:SAM-dependent methyltransferase
MARDSRSRWDEAHARDVNEAPRGPARFLEENVSLLVPGQTLDLAAGSGRNALFLAAHGHRVLAADLSRVALDAIRRANPRIDLVQVDLDQPCFRRGSLDNVACIDFLDRKLFPEIHAWLRPGGILLLDTFLIDQRALGHPRNPDFLLAHNELLERLRGGYRILRYREGAVSGPSGTSYRAGVVAARAGGSEN